MNKHNQHRDRINVHRSRMRAGAVTAAALALALLFATAAAAEDQGARRHAQGAYDPATSTYEVVKGDDLSDIAARFGVSVGELKARNDLSSDVIDVGQQLQIPGKAAPAVPGAVTEDAAGYKLISGTMGAPDARASISGEQLPAPAPPFGGVIKDDALSSTPWWAPRIAPPEQAPNILLIITDDAGFGVPSTFGGVIPTPTNGSRTCSATRHRSIHSTARRGRGT